MNSDLILSENAGQPWSTASNVFLNFNDDHPEKKILEKTSLNLNYELNTEISQSNYGNDHPNLIGDLEDDSIVKLEQNQELFIVNVDRVDNEIEEKTSLQLNDILMNLMTNSEKEIIIQNCINNSENCNLEHTDEQLVMRPETAKAVIKYIDKLDAANESNNGNTTFPEIDTEPKNNILSLSMCFNCAQIFPTETFNSHICNNNKNLSADYVNNNNNFEQNNEIDTNLTELSLISNNNNNDESSLGFIWKSEELTSFPPPTSPPTQPTTTMPQLQNPQAPSSFVIIDESVEINKPENSFEISNLQCIKLLEENNSFIQNWLKSQYKCDISQLNNENSDKAELNMTPSKKLSGPHICKLCDRKFVHASGLSRHLTKHQQENIMSTIDDVKPILTLKIASKCTKCSRIFQHIDDALVHIDDHICEGSCEMIDDKELINREIQIIQKNININISNINNNGNINKDAPTASITDAFIKMMILTSVLQCEFCDFVFPNVSSLLLHSGTHDPKHGYQCSKCKIEFTTVKDYLKHATFECVDVRYCSETNRSWLPRYYSCNVCENKFTSLNELYEHRHKLIHLFPRKSEQENDMIFLGCEMCGKLFETAKSYIIHYQEAHVKLSVKKRNDLSTGRIKSADNNMDVVDGVLGENSQNAETSISKSRKYLCDVCGKSYTQSSHLWQHLRFHKGVKPFECKEPNCTRRFTIRPDLNDHIRKCHTGERPYHCELCGKRFLTGSVYYQHRLIHRGERRYGCEECGKRFYRADALKNHQRIHTGEKPYACTHCPKCFRQRGDRDKHVRVRHAINPIPKTSNLKNRYRSTAPLLTQM